MSTCIQCGKEITNRNKKYCSSECRTVHLRNYRKCVICKKEFWTSPSSDVRTCGRECETKNRRLNGKSEWMSEYLNRAHEACKQSPNTGSFDTNRLAKSWGLVDPNGKLYEVNNLYKWCIDHVDIIPYVNPKTFVTDLYKIKAGKLRSVKGWTLAWWSEKNFAREGYKDIELKQKRTKITNEERLQRKRERAKNYYQKKKMDTVGE